MSIQRPERIFTGKVASPGLVAGRLRFHCRQAAGEIAAGSPVEEALRLDRALSEAAAQLGRLSGKVEETGRGILEFQIALIEDDELVEPVRRAIAGGAPPRRPGAGAWMARSRNMKPHPMPISAPERRILPICATGSSTF